MLERLNTPEQVNISTPDKDVIDAVNIALEKTNNPIFAEIGVGIGATTLEISRVMNNRGEIHIFDFSHQVNELKDDLSSFGFNNVIAHGNSKKYWDSYNWSLGKMLETTPSPIFDVIYIDGAHTFAHDALAFFLCDRLLKVGGTILFDDYWWKFVDSKWMAETRLEYMTDSQVSAPQVKMVIDSVVRTHPSYVEVIPNKSFIKV